MELNDKVQVAISNMEWFKKGISQQLICFNKSHFNTETGFNIYTVTNGDSIEIKGLISAFNIPDFNPEFIEIIYQQVKHWFQGQPNEDILLCIDALKQKIIEDGTK